MADADRGVPAVIMLDKITEEIAHFIGVFHVSVEDARYRESYQEFTLNPVQTEPDVHPVVDSTFAAPFELLDYEPGIDYRSPGHDPWHVRPWTPMFQGLPRLHGADDLHVGRDHHWSQHWSYHAASKTLKFDAPEMQPPGSVANYLNQAIVLSDDDYFSVGGHNLEFSPDRIDNSALFSGAEYAASLSPLGDLERPGSSAETIEVIKTAITQLDAASGPGVAQIFLHGTEAIDGTYVNGELVAEAPLLEDHYTFDDKSDDSEPDPQSNTFISEDGSVTIKVSVELQAGGDTLVNDAVMKNFWSGGAVTAVLGDHIELNAIIQINAIWDTDAITSAVNHWTTGDANELYNIATFERLDNSGASGGEPSHSSDYPAYWSITEIKGDLMIVNWLEQLVFMSDNDVGVLSSSGVTTSIVSGDNLGMNHASVVELGFGYDLIIIGGSVYDANIIQQMNVLFDNDVVGAVSGFQTTGAGAISSSGNLLWNQAHIYNIGGADRFDSLPQDYLDAATGLAGGGKIIPGGVLSDHAFAGLDGLRVLYISGDLINLQYIKQTNILGDSDQIALAMDAVSPHPGAEWSISTGSNALLNNAVIVDLDSFGKTYVGGEQYSQETLFQAELISHQPDFGASNPDALVNEAILFLDDSMLAPDATQAGANIPADYDAHPDDGLNTMLGH
jgi:hypothetical protein